MNRFYKCLLLGMFEPILGRVTTPYRGPGIPSGSERTSPGFACGYSAGESGTTGPGAGAVGTWLDCAGGGPHRSFNPASRTADRPSVPARRTAQRPLRKAGPGCGAAAGPFRKAAAHRHGLRPAAARLCPLDGPVGRRAGRPEEIGSEGWPGDRARLVAQPRPETVAGKKCGAGQN